jgi:hypothetical protein
MFGASPSVLISVNRIVYAPKSEMATKRAILFVTDLVKIVVVTPASFKFSITFRAVSPDFAICTKLFAF